MKVYQFILQLKAQIFNISLLSIKFYAFSFKTLNIKLCFALIIMYNIINTYPHLNINIFR